MQKPCLNRRKFLVRALLTGAGTGIVTLIPDVARALSVEENSVHEQLYLAACESRTSHDTLMEDLVRQLEAKEAEITPEIHARAVDIVSAMNCPVCGCRLGGAPVVAPAEK